MLCRVSGKQFVGRLVEVQDASNTHMMVELVDTSHPTEDHYIHKQLVMVWIQNLPCVSVKTTFQDGRAKPADST